MRIGAAVRVTLAVGLAAVLVAGSVGLVAAVPAGAATDQGPVGWRREVMAMLNDARHDADLARLRINRGLSRDALAHSRRMVAERRVFHTPNVDDLVEPYGASVWAEELARGRTLAAIVRAWLHHADTRGHLLDRRMEHAAIGVQYAHGRYWVTVYLHD